MEPGGGYIEYIINPKSGSSSNKLLVSTFRDHLRDGGYDVRTHFTQSLDHASRIATTAGADPGCMLVAAAGGDGTIREVAHGLEGSGTPLLIIPSGTENLLGNELGFDTRPSTVIKAFHGGCVKPLDLGRANGRCFTSIAGFGFDGTVVKIVNEKRTGYINHFAYFWPLWQTFWGHRFPQFQVEADGEEIFRGRGMVFVGNISRYAVGLGLLHRADYGDGLLDVCIYRCRGRVHLLKHSVLTVFKQHIGRKDVIYKQCKHIKVSSPSQWVNTEIDGDPGPSLPMDIEVVPHAVKVLVPPNAKPAGLRTRLIRMLT